MMVYGLLNGSLTIWSSILLDWYVTQYSLANSVPTIYAISILSRNR